MSPREAEDLPDVVWDSMVRRMVAEAEAIEKRNAQFAKLTRR